MVLTVSFALSLVSRAFLPPSPARSSPCKLDASVGASGPHDFAVRDGTARLAAPSASIASRAPRSWRRVTPLLTSAGRQELYCCFYRMKKRKISCRLAGQKGKSVYPPKAR